jgi:hypothetical protein
MRIARACCALHQAILPLYSSIGCLANPCLHSFSEASPCDRIHNLISCCEHWRPARSIQYRTASFQRTVHTAAAMYSMLSSKTLWGRANQRLAGAFNRDNTMALAGSSAGFNVVTVVSVCRSPGSKLCFERCQFAPYSVHAAPCAPMKGHVDDRTSCLLCPC